jgi:hypothetical protein
MNRVSAKLFNPHRMAAQEAGAFNPTPVIIPVAKRASGFNYSTSS